MRRFSLFGFGVIDQGVSSLNTLALGLAVVHSSSPEEFGAFSVLVAAYFVILSAARGFVSLPALLRYDKLNNESPVLLSMALGIIVGIIGLAALILAGSDFLTLVFPVAIFLPVLLAQDAMRYFFFSASRPSGALFVDGIVLAITAPCYLLEYWTAGPAYAFLWTWVLSVSISVVIAAFVLDVRIASWSQTIIQLTTNVKSRVHSGVEVMLNALTSQSSGLMLAGFGSLTLAAGFRVLTGNLFGVLNVAIQGMQPQLVVAAKTIRDNGGGGRHRLLMWTVGASAIPAFAIAVLVQLEPRIGLVAGGSSFAAGKPYLWQVAALFGSIAVSSNISSIIRTIQPASVVYRMRLWISGGSVVFLYLGLLGSIPLSLQISFLVSAAYTVFVSSWFYIRASKLVPGSLQWPRRTRCQSQD